MRPGRRTPAAFLAFMTPHDGSGMIIIRHALVTRRDGFAVPALPLATSPILAQTGAPPMRIPCTFADQHFTYALQDSPP